MLVHIDVSGNRIPIPWILNLFSLHAMYSPLIIMKNDIADGEFNKYHVIFVSDI